MLEKYNCTNLYNFICNACKFENKKNRHHNLKNMSKSFLVITASPISFLRAPTNNEGVLRIFHVVKIHYNLKLHAVHICRKQQSKLRKWPLKIYPKKIQFTFVK